MDVLLIGEAECREFTGAVCWLREHTRLNVVANVEEAIRDSHLAEPRVILFAQSRPGQISLRDVELIHAHAPLARLVVLLGSWCEGEMRSGKPWPGVMRIYWPEFRARLGVLLGQTLAREPARWDLPRTATDADLLLAARVRPARQSRGLAAISARTHVAYESVAEVCSLAGLASMWLAPGRPVAVKGTSLAFWDSSGWGPFEEESLARFAREMAPVPLVALVDFPRQQECEQILRYGAAAVVPKPFLVDDLLWQIDQILGSQGLTAQTVEAA